jgi:hypothetical protein
MCFQVVEWYSFLVHKIGFVVFINIFATIGQVHRGLRRFSLEVVAYDVANNPSKSSLLLGV